MAKTPKAPSDMRLVAISESQMIGLFMSLVLPNPASIVEGDVGTKQYPVTIQSRQVWPYNIDFRFRTIALGGQDGATPGVDYVAIDQRVMLPAGDLSVVINVTINGDTVFEPDEMFDVGMSDFRRVA